MLYQLSYRGCAMQLLLRSSRLGITLECQPGFGFSLFSLYIFGLPLFPSCISRLYTGARHENVGAPMSSRCHQGAHGVVVSHPLSMREAPGSIPGVSIFTYGDRERCSERVSMRSLLKRGHVAASSAVPHVPSRAMPQPLGHCNSKRRCGST